MVVGIANVDRMFILKGGPFRGVVGSVRFSQVSIGSIPAQLFVFLTQSQFLLFFAPLAPSIEQLHPPISPILKFLGLHLARLFTFC